MADIHGTREELVAMIASQHMEIERLRAVLKEIAACDCGPWGNGGLDALEADLMRTVINLARITLNPAP